MAQITYDDKVDLNTTQVADINKVKASDMNEIKDVVNENYNETNQRLLNIGKQLWTGSFATGSITVPGISDYIMIAINVGGVLCIGNQRYGGCVFTKFTTLETTSYGYRYTYDSINETLTVDASQTGATDGTTRQTITEIYGIF